jgi:hypothetical protein
MHPPRLVLLALAPFFAAPVVQALQLQWEFSGVVVFVNGGVGGVQVGDTFTGVVDYNNVPEPAYTVSAEYSNGWVFSAQPIFTTAIDPQNVPELFLGYLGDPVIHSFQLIAGEGGGFFDYLTYTTGILGNLNGPVALRVPDAASTGLCLLGALLLAAVARRRRQL